MTPLPSPEDRHAPFQCPECGIRFAIRAAAEVWQETLEFSISDWLKACVIARDNSIMPGACPHICSALKQRGC